MNIQRQCPNVSELSDLLEGNLTDPELSQLVEHLENCSDCLRKVGPHTSRDTLSVALRSESNSIDTIANRTPRQLVERVKQIPLLAPDRSGEGDPENRVSQASQGTVVFSADPTPGGLGRLGPYRILKLLGSGGMGSVFLAEDTKLHRHVALKVMLPKISTDPLARKRFLREARAAASLKSDHIVTIHQVDEENDVPFLSMELLQGRSLDELIRSEENVNLETIVQVALGVAKGLADAHDKGLIHRDIKPGNIWIEDNDEGPPRVKILDFGLARMVVDDTHLTQTCAIVGTPAFMAPEQARGEISTDARSDLFSLGCVIYYMCIGEVPFKSDSTYGTLMALAVNTPQSPADRNASIPLKLSHLTMKLLEKDPSKRPQTARDVVAAIKVVERELKSGTAEFVIPQSKAGNRYRYFGIAAAVGLAALLGITVLSTWFVVNQQNVATIIDRQPVAPPRIDRSTELLERANERLRTLTDELKTANPNFLGAVQPTIQNGEIVGLSLSGNDITNLGALCRLKSLKTLKITGAGNSDFQTIDLSTIGDLSLTKLSLDGKYVVSDLNSLKGMPLSELSVDDSPISDLSPLQGMRLRKLNLWSWTGTDLSPLVGMPLQELNIGGNNKLMDLTPLTGAPLEFLCVNVTQVSDLSPLNGLPIKRLYCSNTKVWDLKPVQEAPIEEIMVDGSLVRDITIAKGWPLKWIKFDHDIFDWYQVLKDIPTLQRIHEEPAATVLAEFDPQQWPVREAAFVNKIGMEFALVPKGKTLRGTGNFDAYLGSREIEISNDFYLGRYEVTQQQWTTMMGDNPSYFSSQNSGADRIKSLTAAELLLLPVENVSWLDCQRFLEKLNEMEKGSDWMYRLPTEAEWTYACQGGPMTDDFDRENAFYFDKPSKTLPPHKANTNLGGLRRTCRVGAYVPNKLGLFDMHGNVFEWCDDLASLSDKRARWIHGGGWADDAERCKVSNLLEPTEPWTYYDLGFRVARVRTN